MGKKIAKKSKDHTFELKGSQDTYYPEQITVDFDFPDSQLSSSSSSSSDSSPPSNKKGNFSIIPTFNNDRITYTPSFYTPYKPIKLQNSLEKHQRKIEKYQQIDESSIMVPKPRKRPFCYPCNCSYYDYLRHIEQSDHQRQTINHYMHLEIVQLCNDYNRKYSKNIVSQNIGNQEQKNDESTLDKID